MKKVVIFGIGDFASLAWYALTHDSAHEVAAFTADAAFIDKTTHHGLPVVPFESLPDHCPPDEFALLIPLGSRNVNRLRMDRFHAAKAMGYSFISHISPRALVWPDFKIGENCMVYEGCIIQPFARVGDNCILRSGCNISHHVEIDDHVFIASGALIGGGTRIGHRCFIGLGAIIRDGISVAAGCTIGAGAVVVDDTAANGLYVGVPARRREINK